MKISRPAGLFAALLLAAIPAAPQKEAAVTGHVKGTFDVKMTPQGNADKIDGSTLGRASADKQYHGDLDAVGKGEMLSALTSVQGSAAYVAIERVNGTLLGRTGSFILQHTGVMTRGVPQLTVTVVPDSGAGQLSGIAGKMIIENAGGKHTYDFEFTLPEAK